MTRRRYLTKSEAVTLGLLCRSDLRIRRLKPAPGQQPANVVWQGHGFVAVYDVTKAIPMPPYRRPTPAQLEALARGRELLGTVACGGCGTRTATGALCYACMQQSQGHEEAAEREASWNRARRLAAEWLSDEPVFLDTETTGLGDHDQVIEIAMLDIAGNVLLHSLVRPSVPISAGARRIHGIGDDELTEAPTFAELWPGLSALLRGRTVISHNSDFDRRIITQSTAAAGIQTSELMDVHWHCTMRLLTDLNGGPWPSLNAAVELAGAVLPNGRGHRAVRDADCVRRCVMALAGR